RAARRRRVACADVGGGDSATRGRRLEPVPHTDPRARGRCAPRDRGGRMSSWPVAVPARPSRLSSRFGRTALPLAASAASGGALVWLSPTVEAALVVAIAVACATPLVVRAAQRRFDLLEPLVATNVALAVMFVAQPAAVLAAGGDRVYKGIVIG